MPGRPTSNPAITAKKLFLILQIRAMVDVGGEQEVLRQPSRASATLLAAMDEGED
jgi:hypothetical protein